MLTMRQLHQRFHDSTGVTFASLYPGALLRRLPARPPARTPAPPQPWPCCYYWLAAPHRGPP